MVRPIDANSRRKVRNVRADSSARSTARRILQYWRVRGARRSCINVYPELRSRASASRSSAVSFVARRRSRRISCWEFQRGQPRHIGRLTTTVGAFLEPPTGCRARDAEIRCDGHVPGALDEIAKPVVVALLRLVGHRVDVPMNDGIDHAGAGRTADAATHHMIASDRRRLKAEQAQLSLAEGRPELRLIIGGSFTQLNLSKTLRAVRQHETHSDDNSRRKVQNVRVDSSGISLWPATATAPPYVRNIQQRTSRARASCDGDSRGTCRRSA